MRAQDLELKELLDFDSRGGVVRFAGRRALILDAVALGLWRKELIDTMGMIAARALLTRFGYAHGQRMADGMREQFHWENDEEWFWAGPRIFALQGLFLREPGRKSPLSTGGVTWLASYEAEQHLLHLGRADEPVCWTLCGLASGYISSTIGKEVYVLEDRCIAQGDAACHVAARTLEEWGSAVGEHLAFFKREGLDAVLRRLTEALKRAERQLRVRQRSLEQAAGAGGDDPSGLVARSGSMRQVVDLARRVAQVDSTVLITGESGTGKERIARLIHDASSRSHGPFVAVNCAAITETLLESELFGHARGAFTGAMIDRPGLFEAARGGILFLDEVGEIPMSVQAKLLRALQEREVRRVGENRNRPIDVRIVAATNHDLGEDIANKHFRKDLYYRLKVVELKLPPLRERRDDVLPLARVFIAQMATRMKRRLDGLSPGAADQLLRYDWPGNVRELENVIERAVALAQGSRIDVEDLPEEVRAVMPIPVVTGPVRRLVDIEQEYILAALAANDDNQTRTAAQLGLGTTTLYRKLKRYRTLRTRKRAG